MSAEIELLLERLGPYLDECAPRITIDEIRLLCAADRGESVASVGVEQRPSRQHWLSVPTEPTERSYVEDTVSMRGRCVRFAAALAVVTIVAALALNGFAARGSTSMRLGGVSGVGAIALAPGVEALYDATTAIPAGWKRRVNRDAYKSVVCTEYIGTVSGPACVRLEGPILVSAFSYTAPTTIGEGEGVEATAANSVPRTTPASISIGTTFTDLGIEWFTNRRGPRVVDGPVGPPPGSFATPTTVNGLPGVIVESSASTHSVVWSPSPGVVVAVDGDGVDVAMILDVARAVAPAVQFAAASLPVVVAAVEGVRWSASDNNHPYLLATKRDGRECVGFGWFDDCSQRFVDRIFSRFAEGRLILSGAVPPTTTTIRIERVGLEPLLVNPNEVEGFTSRFFAVDATEWSPVAVKAVGPDGQELGRFVDGVDSSEHTVRLEARQPAPTSQANPTSTR